MRITGFGTARIPAHSHIPAKQGLDGVEAPSQTVSREREVQVPVEFHDPYQLPFPTAPSADDPFSGLRIASGGASMGSDAQRQRQQPPPVQNALGTSSAILTDQFGNKHVIDFSKPGQTLRVGGLVFQTGRAESPSEPNGVWATVKKILGF